MKYGNRLRSLAAFAIWSIALFAGVTAGQGLADQENGKIAFTSERDGNREIYSINPDGSDTKRLTYNPGADDYPAWSPDGKKVAYLSQESDGQYRIKTMSADGDQQQTITSIIFDLSTLNFCGEQFSISWSPDGKRIAFQEFGDIVTISIDGSDRQTIGSSIFRESEPAWGPTGILAYTLTLQRADDRNGLQISTTEGSLYADYGYYTCSYSADWSPDARKLAYMHANDFPPPGYIEIVAANGSYGRSLFSIPLGKKPKWSPDGRLLTYASCQQGIYSCDSLNISITDEFGQGFRVLTPGTNPSWQPVHNSVVVSGRVLTTSGQGLRNTVVTLTDSRGKRRSTLTSTLGYYSFPDISTGETVTIAASSRRYRFQTITREVNEGLTNVDLMGIE